VKNINI